jgi:hypothetical protein
MKAPSFPYGSSSSKAAAAFARETPRKHRNTNSAQMPSFEARCPVWPERLLAFVGTNGINSLRVSKKDWDVLFIVVYQQLNPFCKD